MTRLTRASFVFAAFMSLLPAAAVAKETVVSFPVDGKKVMATLQVPDKTAAPPVVLLLHGFTGSRNELPIKDTNDGVFSRTARLLEEQGLASLRIDFRGSGESEGAWEDTTFSSQIADAIAAIDWLKTQKEVDGTRIALIGWSQGGLVAAHAAMARPELKSVTLWAPVANPLATFSSLIGAETVAKGLSSPADTVIAFKLPWGAESKLKAAYFQELAGTNPPAATAHYAGPLQVIVGSKDTTVAPQPASGQVFLTYHDGPEELKVFAMDHVFNAFEGPKTIDGELVPATVGWIKQYQ